MVQLVIKVFLIMLHIMKSDYREHETIYHLGRNMIEMVKEDDAYLIDTGKLKGLSELSIDEKIAYYEDTGEVLNYYKHLRYRSGKDNKILFSFDLANNDKIGYRSLQFKVYDITEQEFVELLPFFKSCFSSKLQRMQSEHGEYWYTISDKNIVNIRHLNEDNKLNILFISNYEHFTGKDRIGPIIYHHHTWGADNID